MVDVGLIGGESVGVTEFRGVEEDAMGRRGGVRGEGGPAGAGNQEGGEDSLMIVDTVSSNQSRRTSPYFELSRESVST